MLEKIRTDREVISPTSASNHQIEVLRMVKLSETMATYTGRVPFVVVMRTLVVVRTLGMDALQVCLSQDIHVERIKSRRRTFLVG